MRKLQILALLVLLAITGTSVAGWDEAVVASERGDYREAARHFKPLAEQGNRLAQYNLGVYYRDGKGVPQDYQEALKWFRKAAEQGLAAAQNNLGIMYAEGQGISKDYSTAYMWATLAAIQNPEYKAFGIELRRVMTRDQIAEGQRMTAEWLMNYKQ